MTTREEMDKDRQELIRTLYAAVTELLETAHEITIEGQKGHPNADIYRAQAGKLCSINTDVNVLTKAIAVLAEKAASSGGQI